MNILRGLVILAASCAVTIAGSAENIIINIVLPDEHTTSNATCIATMEKSTEDKTVEAVIDGINQFAPIFFKEITSSNLDDLVVSSFSAVTTLSMLAYGSSGVTEKEFKRLLYLPKKSVGKIGYANLIDSINAVKGIELRLANKMFIDESYTIDSTFYELIHTTFGSSFQTCNFLNVQGVAEIINEWVGDNSNYSIKAPFQPYVFAKTTNMMLVDVIYFKTALPGLNGSVPLDSRTFYLTRSRSLDVPYISWRQFAKYNFFPQLGASLVELPHASEEFSIIIILPEYIDGLASVEKKLTQVDLIELVETANETIVDITIPQFKIKSTVNLLYPLRHMGLRRALDKESNYFSEIFDTGLYIENYFQIASIEVVGEGNAFGPNTITSPKGKSNQTQTTDDAIEIFYVDHPFLFILLKKDKLTNKQFQLFSARVVNPLE